MGKIKAPTHEKESLPGAVYERAQGVTLGTCNMQVRSPKGMREAKERNSEGNTQERWAERLSTRKEHRSTRVSLSGRR